MEPKMAGKKFSHLTGMALLLALLLPSGLFSDTKPELRGFDLNVFDYHLGRADREVSPERW